MDPPQSYISVPIEQWDRLNYQLRRLKEQNIFLRQKYNRDLSPLISKNRSLDIYDNKLQRELGGNISEETDEKKKFATRMGDWSKRLDRIKYGLKLNDLSEKRKKLSEQQEAEVTAQQLNLFKLNRIAQNQNQQGKYGQGMQDQQCKEPYEGMKIIQSICLFGPREQQLQKQIPNGKINFTNQLLYINNIFAAGQYEVYASQFYTDEGVPGRKLKQSEQSTKVDQMIFRKNVKGSDCSLMLFRPEQENPLMKQPNKVLDQVNAIKLLSAFYVQFSDFCYIQYEQDKQQKNSPNKSMENNIKAENLKIQSLQIIQQKSNRVKIQKLMKKYCIKSKYCLCIFTYFPFVNLMEQMITSILDQIKIRRVQKYAIQNSKQKVSVKYVIHELNKICIQLKHQIETIPTQIGTQATFSLGHFKIVFNFFQNKLDDLIYGGWAFQIMKLFDRDTIYDIFTNIMTEQSICFVSQNLKLLTHVLFFFVSVLPKPFSYPHPCICRALQYEWLQSPFVVTIGLNQSSKWVEQNADNYQKKIFVDLNDNQIKVRGKRKLKTIKSQKLKKIFHNFYKKLQGNSPLPQFFKKRQTVIRPAAREENQFVYIMLKSLQNYYEQQIFSHLPNPQIISYIKQKSPELNEHSKISGLLKQVQKYLKQSRKQKQKDNFIQLLVQQQIFYMYVSKFYQLQ